MAAGANAALRAALAAKEEELSLCWKIAKEARARVRSLSRELEDQKALTWQEQATRVAAQNGLVAYMKEHGIGHRIGYDPTEDQALPLELLALARAQRHG